MSVFRYIWCWLSYWSPWCIWNIRGREHNHYRSMCDMREIKKEVLHHVSKSPCVSANNPPSSAYKNSRPPQPGPAVTQDIYLYKHRNLEFCNPFGTEFTKSKKISDWPLLFPFLDACHLRGILGSFYENENILPQSKSLCVCMLRRAGTAATNPRVLITAPRKTPRWRNMNGSCTRTPVFWPLFQTLFSNVQSPYPIVEAPGLWGKSKTNDTENLACPRQNIRGKWGIG